ncbi:MAG: biotin transporter BioY [Chlamydiae bacterium]|nr:biotin transporter BioY [Chlamydiota bacterium]
MPIANFSSLAYPTVRSSSWVQDILKILVASLLISLSSYIRIPLFFTPIPLVLQSHVVLLMAALLGAKRGTLATLIVLFLGMLGLPVFAGATPGLLCLMGPTAGYLVGYVCAAFLTGYLFDRIQNQKSMRALLSIGLGNIVIYFFGASWLSMFLGWSSSLMLGVIPFLIGDLLKVLCVTKGLQFWHRRFS